MQAVCQGITRVEVKHNLSMKKSRAIKSASLDPWTVSSDLQYMPVCDENDPSVTVISDNLSPLCAQVLLYLLISRN